MPEARDGLSSIYGEYGWRPTLTLGAKIDRTLTGDTTTAGFVRWHLSPTHAPLQIATEVVIGRIETQGAEEPSAALAGTVGRGFSSQWGNGWAEADLRATRRMRSGTAWGNLDLTLGLAFSEKGKIYVQSRTFIDRHDSTTILAPAWLRALPFGMTAKLGLAWEVGSGLPPGLEIGTWFEF